MNGKVLIIAVAIVMIASAIVVGTSSSGDSGGGLTISDVGYTSGSVVFSGTSQDADVVKFFVTYPDGTDSQYGAVHVVNHSFSGAMKLDLSEGDYILTVFTSSTVKATASFSVSGISIISAAYDYESGLLTFSGTSTGTLLRFYVGYPDGGQSPYGYLNVKDGKFDGSMKITLPSGSYELVVFASSTVRDSLSFESSGGASAGVTLDKHSVTITAESDETLEATAVQTGSSTVTWKSSNSLIVSVEDGKLTAKAYGTATITVTSGEYSDSCAVTVEYAPLKLSDSSMTLTAGSSGQLSVEIPAGYSASGAVWRVSSNLIKVSGSGSSASVTAGSKTGSATVTVIIGNLYSAECQVTVTAKPSQDNVYYFEIRMDVDADKVESSKYTQDMLESGFTISATAKNAADALQKACDANDIPLKLYSDAKLKGWINSMFGLGDVKLEDGSWKYWIQYREGSYNGKTLGYYEDGGTFQLIYGTTTLAVSIQGAPTGSMEVGSTASLKAFITPDNREPGTGEKVTWKSSDASVATVSSSGKLTAVGVGTATITVEVDYGSFQVLEGSVKITVVQKGQGTDDPDRKEETTDKTNTDGSKETSKTTTSEDSQGNKVEETIGTKENPDGTKTETESNTVTRTDGSSSTTKTETEYDSQGNVTGKTETVSETTVVKNKDGTTSEKTSETVTKQDGSKQESESTVTTQKDGTKQEQRIEKSTEKDGSVVETSSTSVTSKDGTVKTEGTSSSKDASGNASGTTEFTETVQTASGKTTTTRTESYKDAGGNASGSKDIVTEQKTTSSGTETVKKESVKDAEGNAVSSTESTTKVQTKTVSGGSNTVTTSSEVSKDADGNTTSSREEVRDVTIGKDSTKVESTVVQKDADGKETLRQELSSQSETAKDGSVTTTVSQKETSTDKTVESSSKTVKGADGSESKESTRTTSTTDEVVEEKTESSKVVSEGSTTETKKAQETVKDAQGNVKSETEKIDESVESVDGKSKYSSEQVKKDGSVELTESSSMESADGSVSSKTEVSVKDGTVQKAESVTSVSASEGKLDADAVKTAVEQSKASIGKTSVKTEEVQKTLKVESSEGTGVTLSPEALGMISDHGASLKVEGSVGSSRGSVTVDSDVCTNLSKDSEGQIDLRMDEGRQDELTDAQKRTVEDRYFIILGATVGDKKVHELGGKASVSFGYTPRDGQDVSRLCVFYIDDDGNRTRMDSSFDPETGMFSMHTDHFSVFMVGEIEEEAEDGGSNIALIAGIVVAIIAIVAAAIILRTRRA